MFVTFATYPLLNPMRKVQIIKFVTHTPAAAFTSCPNVALSRALLSDIIKLLLRIL